MHFPWTTSSSIVIGQTLAGALNVSFIQISSGLTCIILLLLLFSHLITCKVRAVSDETHILQREP